MCLGVRHREPAQKRRGAGERSAGIQPPTPEKLPACWQSPGTQGPACVPVRRVLFSTLATRGRAAPEETRVKAAQTRRQAHPAGPQAV